jgi:D-3-phosphoglycerate dehydrogenase
VVACLRNEPGASLDVAAATKRGIPALFAPGRNAVAVAEYTLGLMISIARSIPTTHHLLRYTDELTAVSYSDKSGERKNVTSEWSMDPDAPFQTPSHMLRARPRKNWSKHIAAQPTWNTRQ